MGNRTVVSLLLAAQSTQRDVARWPTQQDTVSRAERAIHLPMVEDKMWYVPLLLRIPTFRSFPEGLHTGHNLLRQVMGN